MIHIYFGDGKGKTTASVGLAVRAAGCGKQVLFSQFLKGRKTGEIDSLARLGIRIIRSEEIKKFTWEMNEEEKEESRKVQSGLLDTIREAIREGAKTDLVILDESLGALSGGFLSEKTLKSFLLESPEDLEIVFTGRAAPEWLMERADYITEMKKYRHPFDKGVCAREGFEY
jgi:cob(I)alamin adenosyltransferase